MELLTIKEVSKKLKLNVSDTYKLIRAGHLQALKLGALKVTSLELDRFIKESSGKDFSDLNNVRPLELGA
ncbi:HTH_17 domain-containing protein [Clostridium neonatale]|uniref:helix-turn-helix domain-containing protein n=1 Tax=Clostridium neonatale TaxID=137838 RepID=UPI001E0E763F|nr:helix-turn-helix domain-containing protein [Clostridium neonatale]CAG9702670.1 HTH_17 domain-containing protein [Clostridium neonatale]